MKRAIFISVPLLMVVLFSACKCPECEECPEECPDLKATATLNWDDDSKLVNVTVANVGNKDAGGFMLYINGDEDPVSSNHRPQVSFNINEGLDAGEMKILEGDFAPLAHPDNNNLGNIYAITVIVDAKNMVEECDSIGEANNEFSIDLPVE